MTGKKISNAVVRRLPRYYRYLRELLDSGITRISSGELSTRMNVTASQIRQDLNNFGGFGQQGYGYNVEYLYNEIKKILGITKKYHMIVIGAGNLGQALVNYTNFGKLNFVVNAMFDTNPKIIGLSIKDIPVYDIDYLEKYASENIVDIAILTLPETGVLAISQKLAALDIKAVWNFSPIDLNTCNTGMLVENVHLSDSLMTLSYKLNENNLKH